MKSKFGCPTMPRNSHCSLFSASRPAVLLAILLSSPVSALSDSEHTLNIRTYPFQRLIAELHHNKDKNGITYGSPLWGDMQTANLSAQPILEVEHGYLTLADSPFEFQTVNDLHGRIALLLFGFDYLSLEQEIKEKCVSEVRVKNDDAAFRGVDRIKCKGGFVEMDLRLKYHMNRLGFTDKDYRLHQVNSLIPKYNIHFAYSLGMSPEVQRSTKG